MPTLLKYPCLRNTSNYFFFTWGNLIHCKQAVRGGTIWASMIIWHNFLRAHFSIRIGCKHCKYATNARKQYVFNTGSDTVSPQRMSTNSAARILMANKIHASKWQNVRCKDSKNKIKMFLASNTHTHREYSELNLASTFRVVYILYIFIYYTCTCIYRYLYINLCKEIQSRAWLHHSMFVCLWPHLNQSTDLSTETACAEKYRVSFFVKTF